MSNVNSVLFNVNQDFPETSATGASKARARANIGAASAAALDSEIAQARAGEAAARTEVVQGDGIQVSSWLALDGHTVYSVSNTGQGIFKRVQAPIDQAYDDYGFVKNLTQDANGIVKLECSYIHTATQTDTGLMSFSDKIKLDGIATGAEVNQNAFSNVKVGSTTIEADTKTDTLELAAGSNVTLTPDATGDKVTIAATDTTYTAGTGLTLSGTQFSVTNPFTTADKTKLDGIEPGAQVNQNAFSTVKVGTTAVQADSATDTLEIAPGTNIMITTDTANDKITIAATDTTYTAGTGLTLSGTQFSVTNPFTTADKNKLDGIAPGAEVNQNSFSNVKVGSTTIAADSKTDTLEIAAGSNITLTPDATGDKVTIAATDTTYTAGTGLTLSSGQFSVTNPFTTSDKTRLDGIEPGAQVNQNAFSNVKVGSTTIAADSTTDTLELAAGSNITLTPDATGDKVTIAATDTTYQAGNGLVLTGTTFSVAASVSSKKASLMGATHAGSGTGASSAFLNVPSRTTQGTWVQYSRNGATFNGLDYTMSGRFSFTAFLNLLGSFRFDDADGAIDFAFVFHPTNCTLYFPDYTTTAIDGGQGVLISLTSAKNESVMLKSVLLDVNPTDLSSYSVNVKWYFRISGNLTNIWQTPVQMSNLLTLCQPNYMINEAINYRIKAQGASWNPGLANIGCGFCMQGFN